VHNKGLNLLTYLLTHLSVLRLDSMQLLEHLWVDHWNGEGCLSVCDVSTPM